MPTLNHCISIHDAPPQVAEMVRKKMKEYQKDGYDSQTAVERSLLDVQAEMQKGLDEVKAQLPQKPELIDQVAELEAALSAVEGVNDIDFAIAIDKELPGKSLKAFGRTYIAGAAGYILPDGKMLDFSGNHYGDPGTKNTRNVDHRELNGSSRYLNWDEFELTSQGGTEGMFEFMNQSGAVRWMPEANAISITAPLTREQAVSIIKAYNETKRQNGQDTLLIGADHPVSYNQISSVDMQRPTVDKILAWSNEVFPTDLRPTDIDFSIQQVLPGTGGSTGRSTAAESYLKRLVELTENQITKDEAAQIAGTVADRYKYLQRKMTDGEIDLLTEFKRMGIDPFIKANKEEYMAMTDAERQWALTKAELMATLTDKKEGFRRQEISAKKLEEVKQVAAQHQQETGRNSIETMIDVLMGDPSGKGSIYPWKNKSMGISHEYLAMLKDGIKDFDSWLGMRLSAADEAVLAREILKPGSTGNAQMKNAAEHVRKTFDAMRTRANKAGADIGHIEDYFPQQWNSRQVMLFGMKPADIIKGFKNQAEAIAQSKQAWVDFMMDRVDRKAAQYIDETTGQYFDDARMRQFLEYSFDTLSTNGSNKGTAPGKSGLANRMSKERQLFFKDAESWLEANRLFGSNDLLTGIMNHTERTAKDISLLEMFGPNPDRVYQQLKSEALQQNVGQAWLYNKKLNFADALWMEVTGSRQTAGSGMLADGMAAVRQSMVFSRLGSALLSQLGDLPIFHALATKSDLPGIRTITEIARTLNPANSGDRAAADLLEFGVSALHDDVMSRVMDTTNGKGISAKAAQFTMRAGGMNWWADRMSSGAKLLLARGLSDMSAQRFADLSPGNKALVKRSGITEAEWNQQIQGNQSIMADYNGRDVLAPSLIKDQALREKVWGLIEREATFMALRPDEKTQALIKGTRERGTASSEIVNSMFLFRSFTAAMIQKVAPRLLASLPGESRSKWMYTAGSFMIASTLMAAMSTQLKEINKGRMPRDMEDPRFWAQAFGQAWNLGVIGDLLWGENNRFGQNVTSTIAGPVAGLLEDTYKVTFGNMQKAASGDHIDPLADAVKMIKNYATPNLWYLRPALDQFLWWPLQEMANPGYLQRSQDRIERENKTKHWLPPTEAQRY